MQDEKLVSVVIPVYNVEKYLCQVLECMLEQTYKNWELIMVDDGSTDGSVSIGKEYASKDTRITFIQRSTLPKGAPACRAIGMRLAKGEYLIHFDSDDIIAPYCLEQRVNYMETHKDCDFAVFPMVGFYTKLFDAKGKVFGYKTKGDAIYAILARALPFVVATNIYRRKSFETHDVKWDTDINIYLDADYNLQTLNADMTYEITNLLPDYYYRLSAQNSVCKKITTISRCNSQVHYIKKHTSIFGNKRKYRKALKICAAQVYQNLLMAEDNSQVIDDFLELEIFKHQVILKKALRFIASHISTKSSDRKVQLYQLMFCPVFYLRFVLYMRFWYMKKVKLYNELAISYNGYDDKTKSSIENKL